MLVALAFTLSVTVTDYANLKRAVQGSAMAEVTLAADIIFPSGGFSGGESTLALPTKRSLTIHGAGFSLIGASSDATPVAWMHADTLFSVAEGGSLRLEDLTIVRGNLTNLGLMSLGGLHLVNESCISNKGQLLVEASTFDRTGGSFNSSLINGPTGNATIQGSTWTANENTVAALTGGICSPVLNNGGVLTVTDSLFVSNRCVGSLGLGIGGALGNQRGGQMHVRNCIFDSNLGGAGGALANSGGRVAVRNCTFINNEALVGGGLLSGTFEPDHGRVAETNVTDSVFTGNTGAPVDSGCTGEGGAVAVATNGVLSLDNVQLFENQANLGGAVVARGGTLKMMRCSIHTNMAQPCFALNGFGGGLALFENATAAIDATSLDDNGAFGLDASDDVWNDGAGVLQCAVKCPAGTSGSCAASKCFDHGANATCACPSCVCS